MAKLQELQVHLERQVHPAHLDLQEPVVQAVQVEHQVQAEHQAQVVPLVQAVQVERLDHLVQVDLPVDQEQQVRRELVV